MKLALVLIIAIAFLLLGCTQSNPNTGNSGNNTSDPNKDTALLAKIADCDKRADDNTRFSCYSDLAEEYGLVNICYKIGDFDMKDDCYVRVAIAKNDSSVCEKISNEEKKTNCRETLNAA